MIFTILVGSAAAGILLLWNIFRRRAPYLLDDALLPSDPSSLEEFHVVRKLSKDDRAALSKSFQAGPDFVWIYNGGESTNESDDDEALFTQSSYLMDFIVQLTESYGHIIKCTDTKTGNYLGSICLIPPESLARSKAYEIHTIIRGVGKPPSMLLEDAARNDRFMSMGQLSAHHHEVMKDNNHWYILNLGVAVTAQGKRVGSRLLQQAKHMAGDKPLYLECHNDNVPFYQKNRFRVEKQFALEPKDKALSGFHYNGMVFHQH